MSEDSSEEKTLPASEKKLRDSRKKGKVSQSKDLVSAMAFLAVTGYLFISFPDLRDRVVQLTDRISEAMSGGSADLAQFIPEAIELSARVIVLFMGPLVVILAGTVVVTGIVATLGPVFSFELIKPNPDNINPTKGAERIFAVRNVVEFLKHILKVIILTVAFWLVVRVWVQSLFEIPACGQGCTVPLLFAILKPLAITAAIAFLIIGLVDILIQRQLFLRDMRMTKTEFKREHKDIEGDPMIRAGRRRIWRQDSFAPGLGLRRALFVIVGGDMIVAINANRKKIAVPVICAKAQGEGFAAMLAEARGLGMPVIEDADLARALYKNHTVGKFLQKDYFGPFIKIMKGMQFWAAPQKT